MLRKTWFFSGLHAAIQPRSGHLHPPLPDHATGKGPVRQGHRWQMRAGVQNRGWVFGWSNGSSRILKPSLAGQQPCLRGEEEAHPQLLFAGPARSRYYGPSHFTQGLQLPDFRLPFPQLLSCTHISSTFPCLWVTPKSQPCLQRAARRSKGTSVGPGGRCLVPLALGAPCQHISSLEDALHPAGLGGLARLHPGPRLWHLAEVWHRSQPPVTSSLLC